LNLEEKNSSTFKDFQGCVGNVVIVVLFSVGCNDSSGYDLFTHTHTHTHRTTYNDTPVRRSQNERRKTLELVACTIFIPLSDVNHSYGSRHRVAPTYRYIIWARSAPVRAALAASAKGVFIGT